MTLLPPHVTTKSPHALTSSPMIVHWIGEEEGSARTEILLDLGHIIRFWTSVHQFVCAIELASQGCVIVYANDDSSLVHELLLKLGSSDRGMPVIVITEVDDLEDAVAFMRMGVVDVIRAPANPLRVQAALATACLRLEKSRRRAATMKRVQAVLDLLTDREKEVLAGLTRGFSNKEIGKHLSISPRTVDIHRANIMNKLNAESLSQALRVAFIAEVCGQYNPTLHVQ